MSDKDDYISRKEALKICRRYWHPTYNPIMEEIEKLPSVQPEHKTMAKKETIEKIKEITIKDDFGAFVKSLNLSRDDYKTMMEYIDELPAVQPERKRGKWIYGEHDVTMCDGYRCDKCGFFVPWSYQHKSIDFINDYHFCPSCGADMRGGDST